MPRLVRRLNRRPRPISIKPTVVSTQYSPPKRGGAAVVPASLAYKGTNRYPTNGTTFNISGLDAGAAAAGRYLIVSVWGLKATVGGAAPIFTTDIDAVEVTAKASLLSTLASQDRSQYVYVVALTEGQTTFDIDVVADAELEGIGVSWGILTGLLSSTPVETDPDDNATENGAWSVTAIDGSVVILFNAARDASGGPQCGCAHDDYALGQVVASSTTMDGFDDMVFTGITEDGHTTSSPFSSTADLTHGICLVMR